ncbi:MAG: ABC transporter permease [Pelagibacterium sp. SCN 64-44]|nr:MAG: ABC transporter permease [Pelagibacterium sp. SCN 64-44]
MSYTFQFADIWAARWDLLWGTWLTIRLAALSMVLSLLFATLGAFLRMIGPRPVRMAITAYVELVRNTPFLVQIYIIYFGIPSVGIRLDPNTAALVAMVLNGSAYAIEIIRAGIESVARGQLEAAQALGLGRGQTFRDIVLPQALRNVLAPLESQFILLLLASSVVSAIAANELTAVAHHISSETYRSFEAYITAAVIYVALTLMFSAVFALINKVVFGKLDRK